MAYLLTAVSSRLLRQYKQYTPRITWTSGASSCTAATHQQPEQSHDDKIVDHKSLPGSCLVCDQASIGN
jgi:hypothetical protein